MKPDPLGADAGVARYAVQREAARHRRHGAHPWVVAIEDRQPPGREPFHKLPYDGGAFDALRRPLAEDAGRTALDRLRDEDVAVVLVTAQRDEEAARFDLPRIGKELGERHVVRAAE